MEALKMLISSQELGSQEEVLQALAKEGYTVTQATLSRDLKQLKVAKAASMKVEIAKIVMKDTTLFLIKQIQNIAILRSNLNIILMNI